MKKKWIISCMMSIGILFWHGTTCWASWTAPTHLNIEFEGKVDENTPHPELQWEDVCPLFGAGMQHKKGPLGGGLFLTFSCIEGGRVMVGAHTESPWKLIFHSDEKKISISFFYEKEKLSHTEFPAFKSPFSLLKDVKFSAYTAILLLDMMPMFGRFTREEISSKTQEITGGAFFEDISPYKALTLYHLDFSKNQKVWLPKVLATVHMKKETERHFIYQLEGEANSLDFNEPIWFHNSEGPGHLAAVMRPLLDKQYKKITSSFLENLSEEMITGLDRGYVGIRFGLPLVNGNVFGTKTKFFGLVNEFRHGALKGLSLIFNYWPTVNAKVDNVKASFGGYRANLGWAFSLYPFQHIPLSFGLTPQIGLWNMKFVAPSHGQSVPFSVSNIADLGLSAQTEYTLNSILFRGYYTQDLSINLSSSTKVTAQRDGVDVVWDLGAVPFLPNSIGLSLLGFMFEEVFKFSRHVSQSEADSHGVVVSSLEYKEIYAGAGVALSW